MSRKMKKVYHIIINEDSNEENAKKEQYQVFQKDGETIQVPIGMMVEVPEWLAFRAKEIGIIKDYFVSEVADA